jgi:hypothetical protein
MSWPRIIQRVLTIGLVASFAYLATVFMERLRIPKVRPPQTLPLSPDYYVYPPKSYVRSLADARALVGKPLWVREGYRWSCSPPPGTLGPLEKLEPRRAFQRGGQVLLEFLRDGRPCVIPISSGDRFFLDEIFLIKDPREIYKAWPPETWQKVQEGRIEVGMTETQITFALGFGVLAQDLSRDGDAHRVFDHAGGPRRVRVVYAYGVAKQIENLPPAP